MEELRFILESGQNLKELLETAGPWFFAYLFLRPILVFIGLMVIVIFARELIRKAIGFNDDLIKLRDEMGVGAPGRYVANEFKEMIAWIREHK